jgi:hypothetical protein
MSRASIVFWSFVALLVLVLTLATTACGTKGLPPGGDGSTSTAPSTPGSSTTTLPADAIPHPTGADEVVLRVSTGGGLVPIEYNYTTIPEFTLYGDGRIIVPGATPAIFPGPALPNLQTTIVPEQTVQAILAAAKKAGLFQNGVDYGQPGVFDAGSTTFTINAEGTTYTSHIYALGFTEGGDLNAPQKKARAAITDLHDKLNDPSTLTSAQLTWEPFDFTALAVLSRPLDPTATPGQTDVQPNHLPWPLEDLATSGEALPNSHGLRKVVVSGDDLATLEPLLQQATQITVWKSGDTEYNLWFRPLLPDEAAAL